MHIEVEVREEGTWRLLGWVLVERHLVEEGRWVSFIVPRPLVVKVPRPDDHPSLVLTEDFVSLQVVPLRSTKSGHYTYKGLRSSGVPLATLRRIKVFTEAL